MSYFFVFDGVDGAGKSTQIQNASRFLRELGLDVVVTREPGGTPMAEEVREIILKPRVEEVDPDAEMLLAYAARKQHLVRSIIPQLAAGKTVLCDRFSSSTYAYQVCGNGADRDLYDSLEASIVSGPGAPSGYLIFDLPPSVSAQRVDVRGGKDRMEQNEAAFFERARNGYSEFSRRQEARIPGSVRSIDAAGSVSQVAAQVEAALSHFLQRGLGAGMTAAPAHAQFSPMRR